jgi:hypothetical protein
MVMSCLYAMVKEAERFAAKSLESALAPDAERGRWFAGGGRRLKRKQARCCPEAGGGPPGVGQFAGWRCGGLRVAARSSAASVPVRGIGRGAANRSGLAHEEPRARGYTSQSAQRAGR